MHRFFPDSPHELIARLQAKMALRAQQATEQLAGGVSLCLDQLAQMPQEGQSKARCESPGTSRAAAGNLTPSSEAGFGPGQQAKHLLAPEYSVDSAVCDYRALCEAVVALAIEYETPFSVDQIRTLNRCAADLDADSVKGFGIRRNAFVRLQQGTEIEMDLSAIAKELRVRLHAARTALTTLESGRLSIDGTTGSLLKRTLADISDLRQDSIVSVKDCEMHASVVPGRGARE